MHVHVPAGAVPKDGPSAGVTMATAIASLVRGEPVADDVGMTGEITLTGQVLPIGGLREKSLAAQRAGLKRVIFPRENEPDLDDLPPETREAHRVRPGRHDRGRLRGGVRRQAPGAPRAAPRGVERAGALCRPEARERAREQQLRRRRRRAAAAEQLVLALAAQDERVLVDVAVDPHVVAVRAYAARGDGLRFRRPCRPSPARPSPCAPSSSVATRCEQASRVGPDERERRRPARDSEPCVAAEPRVEPARPSSRPGAGS